MAPNQVPSDLRIPILKSVYLFTQTPEEVLAEIATFLEELWMAEGQTVFQKGDPGESMYIISEGRVKVHDGDFTINYLGKWDVFGEMSALDPEPRSASVTAVEPTQLFRLGRQPLYQLMIQREEVMQGVIHILCQHLRARVREMREDYEYMQQFARVTAAAGAVEAGLYIPESLDEVSARTDELGQLSRVFQRMVREVDLREQRLRMQVAELKIEIDEVKKAHQVAEITETEYFQQLRQKASSLRAERFSPSE
jgi:CRP/FNR family cyclic AMP-dependent transcriptional regulator